MIERPGAGPMTDQQRHATFLENRPMRNPRGVPPALPLLDLLERAALTGAEVARVKYDLERIETALGEMHALLQQLVQGQY